jgi:hypothetical protein
LFPVRGTTSGEIALLLVLFGAACGNAGRTTNAIGGSSPTVPTVTVVATSPTGATTVPVASGSTVSAAPTSTRPAAPPSVAVARLDSPNTPCTTPRAPGDELDEAEQFLRAAARGEDVDDRIAHVEWLGPDGPTQPTSKFLERVHASLDGLRGVPVDLTLAGVPEMSRRCYPGYPAGCDFVGDLHTECVALVQRAGQPSILVVFAHAGRGFEEVDVLRSGAGLAAARAARGEDVDELFSIDLLREDGTRSPRSAPVAELTESLRAALAGASFRSEQCAASGQHLACDVTMQRDGRDLVVRFRVAPNADAGWSIESYALV